MCHTKMGIGKRFNGKSIRIMWILLIIVALSNHKGSCLDFKESNLAISVENGSTSGLIIDCPYELNDNDTHGLEVKWYFKEKPTPVYQWVPGNTPQDLGHLSGRLNTSYQVSSDRAKKHRALAILEPTSELTGTYRCTVSNFQTDESYETTLTVYTPATEFYITYEKTDVDSVRIFCNADGLFPAPTLGLYRRIEATGKYESEMAETNAEFAAENGTFSVNLEKELRNAEVKGVDEFLCSLTIPKTDYQLERKIYYPGGAENAVTNSKTSAVMLLLTTLFSIALQVKS